MWGQGLASIGPPSTLFVFHLMYVAQVVPIQEYSRSKLLS